MITFTNGPAAGVSLSCVRAPLYLRVVRSRTGEWDALDQISDTPKATETITAYRRVGSAGSMHLSYSTPSGPVAGRSGAIAEYELCAEQPSDEVARDNEAWRNWATEQNAKGTIGP